jgi:Mn2+/Fe2+ NRAMP family transporter
LSKKSRNKATARTTFFSKIVLGLVVAATGVGAGDLITGSLAGSNVGIILIWAALGGALIKFVLNEGIARWQMATGSTILEGWVGRLGRWIQWVFIVYFLLWSYVVGGALINACGVAGVGLFPVGDPHTSKIAWGIFHSLLGLVLVWFGGFKIFQYAMSALTGIMFVTLLGTVFLISPDWGAIGRTFIHPSLPPHATGWLLGVLGGIGGTVTLLSYSYWIREKKRAGAQGLRECRLDLGVGYGLTGFFGAAMVIIGSKITVKGQGATVALALAEQLGRVLGPAGQWIFLAGFWGAVFSSLLGVWQGVPYLFVDFLQIRRNKSPETDIEKTRGYKGFLIALATLPVLTLWLNVQSVQLVYAVMGSLFLPLLALTLLLLNNRKAWVGRRFSYGPGTNFVLAATLAFFTYIGAREILESLSRL